MGAAKGPQTGQNGSVITPAPQIICIDCGGRCFLLTYPPDDGIWEPGDVVAYRCEDCLDRWDLVISEDDDDSVARGD
ncbi:MAG: hypothetical protein DRJ50_02870 [Actinobacteria bacterium]|nr:MAG: hypothetical protein DRJ50_02870 [Actinomycetota bacterium]